MFHFLSYCFHLKTIYQNQIRKINITNLRFNFNTLNAYEVFIKVSNIYNCYHLSIMQYFFITAEIILETE